MMAMMDLPRGLSMFREWVSPAQERELIDTLRPARALETAPGRPWDRAYVDRYGPGVAQSGYTDAHRFSLEIIPPLQALVDRLVDEDVPRPDAVTVGWYLPGHYMRPHIDSPKAGAVIAIVALAGDATIQFTRELDGGATDIRSFAFSRRMLIIMREAARWRWKHEILPVPELRMSIVFRRAPS